MGFEEDAQEPTYSVEDLKELAVLANKQIELEHRLKELTAQAEEVTRHLSQVSGVDIPAAMEAIGMSDFMLTSGERITVERKIKASIPKGKKGAAFKWLRDNGHGSLIKNIVSASFGRDEDAKATELVKKLDEHGYTVDHTESVHANTLAAFVREQKARGENVPNDLLGVFEYNLTKVAKPKES